jgi:hypothetical protein
MNQSKFTTNILYMKKWLYPLLLLLVITGASCTKTTNQIIPNVTIVVDAQPNDWKYDAASKSYLITVSVSEIDNSTNQSDGVVVAMSRDGEQFEALPEVFNNVSFSYVYKPGTVWIQAQGVNGSTIQLPSGNVRFKITIIPANATN